MAKNTEMELNTGKKEISNDSFRSDTRRYPYKGNVFKKNNNTGKKVLIISGVIILIILIAAGFIGLLDKADGNGNKITGLFVGNSTAQKDKESKQVLSAGPTNIAIVGSMDLQNYRIPIANSNILIEAEELIVVTPEMEIAIMIQEPMTLKDFKGNLIWENAQLRLEGTLSEYLAKYVKISSKNLKGISLRVENGNIKIDQITILKLEGIASGEIEFPSKINVMLDKDKVSIKDYVGPFHTLVRGSANTVNTNTVNLNGKISECDIETPDFGIDVS